MRFKGLDLSLLVVLDALMTERNLTAAARSKAQLNVVRYADDCVPRRRDEGELSERHAA
ncbi:hypothetical protein [Paraburkholderia sp. 31.1]|uniref:hypothetical protein n=1 Tax=Paraburkholderia sp. 31.1 TaxID=2615205 RepID=UPI0016557227|nr:hypothetical protein [Paraburkholderia sp. 31.1]